MTKVVIGFAAPGPYENSKPVRYDIKIFGVIAERRSYQECLEFLCLASLSLTKYENIYVEMREEVMILIGEEI